ncbi:hypothetical protein [Streptomyces sp. NPDC048603]|uniref:hypothetical protein n=1 Tax=Streptomyces sp. NPDC048603 TaxID=3365577 RepID=UPI00371C5BB0
MNPMQRGTLAAHPNPPTSALESLAHVLAIYDDSPDERVVITATTGIYPEAPWTGLRMGDLRRLLDEHAHELAERQREHIRRAAHRERYGSIWWAIKGGDVVADLIDPEVGD